MSLYIDKILSELWLVQVDSSYRHSSFGFFEATAILCVFWEISTRSPLVLCQSDVIHGILENLWTTEYALSACLWLLSVGAFCQDNAPNPRRRLLLLSTVWLLFHSWLFVQLNRWYPVDVLLIRHQRQTIVLISFLSCFWWNVNSLGNADKDERLHPSSTT